MKLPWKIPMSEVNNLLRTALIAVGTYLLLFVLLSAAVTPQRYDIRVGLPAGPLSSPGRDAIHAALYPSDTDYYFFLTDKNGKYYYANTYEQHQQNIVEMERVNNS